MKHVPAPDPPSARLLSERFKGDVQVATWLQRRKPAGHDPSSVGMSQDALTFVLQEVERRRAHRIDLSDYLRDAMVELTPKLGQPDMTNMVEDLAHIWSQPEMLDFWQAWQPVRSKHARGPKPNSAGSKALLATLAMAGESAHAEDAYNDLFEKERLRQVFAGVERAAAERAHARDENVAMPGAFGLSLYEGTMDQVKPLTRPHAARKEMLRANAAMFKSTCDLMPGAGFGKRLLIDGTLIPAWCVQVGKSEDEAIEAARRATCPRAGARMVKYTGTGKVDLDPKDTMTAGAFAGSSNFVRGYYYVVILDQASGWPLVSTLWDGAMDEAEALGPLLRDLFEFFPFIEPEVIAGDGAWDETWAHQLCELYYGIAPVFRHTERGAGDTTLPGGASVKQSIKGFAHDGQLQCMEHDKPLRFHSFERPSRGNLRPGQGAPGHPESDDYKRKLAAREGLFRVRGLDDHGNGPDSRPCLRAKLDWRRLNAYPRYFDGHRRGAPLYAFRQALLIRLKNQMEGYFSRVKGGLSIAGEDADRLRLQDFETVETLLHLGELRFNALSLADIRVQQGQQPPGLPPGELAPLPVRDGGGSRAHGASGATSPTSAAPSPSPAAASPAATAAPSRRRRSSKHTPPPAPAPKAAVARSAVPMPQADGAKATASAAVPATDIPAVVAPGGNAVQPDNVIAVDFARRRRS